MYQVRQGDILFTLVARKDHAFLQLQEDNIVAHGEITGHKHVLDKPAQLYVRPQTQRDNDFGDNRIGYVIAEQATKVVHDEHAQVKLKKGVYEVTQQREYTASNDVHERYTPPKVTRVQD